MIRETSHLKDIVDYLKKNSQKGYSLESLKWALVRQGNMKHEVERAMKLAEEELQQEAAQAARVAAAARPEPKIEPVLEPEKKPFWKKMFG